jgi:hypothetical protein
MGRPIKIILTSVFIYWSSMWLSLILLMLISGGSDSLSFEPVYKAVLGYLLITVLMLSVVFWIWLSIIKKFGEKKYLTIFLWNLTMWIFITIICEISFGVLSGNVHGLSSFRNGWYILLLMSTVYTSISYFYANNKLAKEK